MKIVIFASLFLLAAACAKPPAEKPNDFEFSAPEKLGQVRNKRLQEASGIAASINNPGFLWTHNDSGNPPEVFLIDERSDIKFTCLLAGVENRDWEDVTVGPGPDSTKNYIYVADIGDNLAQYQYKMIYRFEEPKMPTDTTRQIVISDFDRIVFELDQKKDTETLMIDPKSKNLFVVSKREQPVVVYELAYPQSTTDTLKATAIGSIPVTQIVGGDFSAEGDQVLMKNYQNVFYWTINKSETLADAIKREPKILPYVKEPQGEAITFARDGSAYYTISEKTKEEEAFLSISRKK
jgi:hypothetical protein